MSSTTNPKRMEIEVVREDHFRHFAFLNDREGIVHVHVDDGTIKESQPIILTEHIKVKAAITVVNENEVLKGTADLSCIKKAYPDARKLLAGILNFQGAWVAKSANKSFGNYGESSEEWVEETTTKLADFEKGFDPYNCDHIYPFSIPIPKGLCSSVNIKLRSMNTFKLVVQIPKIATGELPITIYASSSSPPEPLKITKASGSVSTGTILQLSVSGTTLGPDQDITATVTMSNPAKASIEEIRLQIAEKVRADVMTNHITAYRKHPLTGGNDYMIWQQKLDLNKNKGHTSIKVPCPKPIGYRDDMKTKYFTITHELQVVAVSGSGGCCSTLVEDKVTLPIQMIRF